MRWPWLVATLLLACSGPGALDGGVNVVFREQPDADWSCAAPSSCTADYLAFPARAPGAAMPLSEDALNAQLAALDQNQVPLEPGPLDAGALAARIVDALNIGALRDDLDARPLTVAFFQHFLTQP